MQIRKAILVMVLLCVLLCGCGKPKTAIEVMEQNKTSCRLEHYQNFTVTYRDEATGAETVTYADAATYAVSSAEQKLICTTDEYCIQNERGLIRFLNMTGETPCQKEKEELSFRRESAEKEKLTEWKQNGDEICMQTAFSPEDTRELFGVGEGGAYCAAEYILDAKTLVIKQEKDYLCRTDGTRQLIGSATTAYNTDFPEFAKQLYNEAKTGADKTVTFFLNPKTPEEQKYELSVKSGTVVRYLLPEGCTEPCTDAACSFPYKENTPVESDITLYAKSNS